MYILLGKKTRTKQKGEEQRQWSTKSSKHVPYWRQFLIYLLSLDKSIINANAMITTNLRPTKYRSFSYDQTLFSIPFFATEERYTDTIAKDNNKRTCVHKYAFCTTVFNAD